MKYPNDPFWNKKSKLMIIGYRPSKCSFDKGFYYENPRNHFWQLVSLAYNEKLPNNRTEKIDFLNRHNIALWDIYPYDGESDSQTQPNDVFSIINNSEVEYVFCNGNDAYKMFKLLEGKTSNNKVFITVKLIQSSSSANGKTIRREKEWKSISLAK